MRAHPADAAPIPEPLPAPGGAAWRSVDHALPARGRASSRAITATRRSAAGPWAPRHRPDQPLRGRPRPTWSSSSTAAVGAGPPGRQGPAPTPSSSSTSAPWMYDPEFQGANLIRLLEGLGLPRSASCSRSTRSTQSRTTRSSSRRFRTSPRWGSDRGRRHRRRHSSLEKIAHLNPRYLKFDMQLIRDIDGSYMRREMARALKDFARKMDSTIIAEGSNGRASSSAPGARDRVRSGLPARPTCRGLRGAPCPRGARSRGPPRLGLFMRPVWPSPGYSGILCAPAPSRGGLADEPRGLEPRRQLGLRPRGRAGSNGGRRGPRAGSPSPPRPPPRRGRSGSPCRSPGPSSGRWARCGSRAAPARPASRGRPAPPRRRRRRRRCSWARRPDRRPARPAPARPPGIPMKCTACCAAMARTRACGSARPTSSEAKRTRRRAT